MLVEDPEALKSWLLRTLGKLCDADPEALTKYILALFKKDKSTQALKTFLLEKLEIFMLHETKFFVDVLFDALESKSYLDPTSEVDLSSRVGSSDSDIPIKSNLDIKDTLQEEHRPSSLVQIKSTDSTPDEFQTYGSSQKRKFDDKHILSKKAKNSSDGNYSTKTSEMEKGKEDDDDGKGSAEKRACRPQSKENLGYSTAIFPPGDTDYRQNQIVDLTTSQIQRECKIAYSTKQSTRCKDYDGLGYCLKGDFCNFDHGNDFILVESVSSLKFGVDISTDQFEGEGIKSPLPPLPTSPTPPQPPPPPPTDPLIPEPYDPESPGMNMGTLPSRGHNMHLNLYVPTPLTSHLFSSSHSLPSMVSKASSGLMWGSSEPFYHHKPKQRIRELIGVTTVDSASVNLDKEQNKDANNDKTFHKPLNSGYFSSTARAQATYPSDFKTKGFNFNRLGPFPRRKCLEIRKIPKSLNTITNLHNHFCKFGNIVNIEVGYAGDPEAAKVSFSMHGEATAAYRSTEPILNNRFIKVFWNNDSEIEMSSAFSKEIKVKESLSSGEINNGASLINASNESSKEGVAELEKVTDKPLISKGTFSRSLYVSNSAACFKKKNTFIANPRKESEKEAIAAHRKKKFEINQAKSELIQSQIENQKMILNQLIKSKNKEEKEFLKKTLLTISDQIKVMQSDFKKDTEELKTLLKGAPQNILKSTAKRELLDAELDLYNKQHAGAEDTAELAQKVLEMKNKAKALGLIGSSPPKSYSANYVYRRYRNPRYHPSSTVTSHSVDHRPRKVLVVGSTDKGSLHNHFQHFGDIEKVDEVSSGIVFTFSSRMEAERAYIYGSKFENKMLTLSWFNDADLEAVPQPDINKESPELTVDTPSVDVNIDEDEDDDDDDEEEEEDSEARSWRH